MRQSVVSIIIAGLVATTAMAASTSTSEPSPRVVSQTFHKLQLPPNVIQFTKSKRDNTLDLAAMNNITGGGYYVEVAVGTPPQQVLMHLDTGSSDTWVVDAGADYCASDALQRQHGYCTDTFDAGASDSYKTAVRGGFSIEYLDGNQVRGDYFTDRISVGGQTIENQQLGLGTDLTRASGILGLGLSDYVAASRPYATVLENMVKQGYIGRAAYSVWLNDLSADEGQILFGGIDKTKYYGKLATFPIIPTFDGRTRSHYTISLTSVSVRNSTDTEPEPVTSSSFSGNAVLDTGSTLTLLPGRVAQPIFSAFGIDDNYGVALVDCGLAGRQGDGMALDFSFGDGDGPAATIRVPMREMVLDIVSPAALGNINVPFDDVCVFGIQDTAFFGVREEAGGSNFVILGDTFLRSAYVVYDEPNMQVGIAQAVIGDGVSGQSSGDIVELASGQKDLPTAAGVDPSEASDNVASQEDGDDDDNAAGRIGGGGMAGMGVVGAALLFASSVVVLTAAL
ncbi:hypothetical protein ACRALDRAFT_2040093 [Sodiomyces alcalophilus JCM 7366]|uniref:uncharacterized protein n=1 Tax=Sodiomyces alcalophilus JCM 7366 TaxID=591952 RepID=UPI0039B38E1A